MTAKEEIKSLRDFFATAALPKTVNINPYETWTDVRKGIASHLSFLEHGELYPYKRPYFIRLKQLKELIIKENERQITT